MQNFYLAGVLFGLLLAGKCYGNSTENFTSPLPSGDVVLSGPLSAAMETSVERWNKGVVPYKDFVEFFRTGRPQFALGEMWGKAVRSGAMFYRYSHDPELKAILDKTVADILTTQRPNGSISCSAPDKQPDGPMGDLWERKYVMLGMLEYYDWVTSDPKVLDSLTSQADALISQVGRAPKKEITDLGWSGTISGLAPNHIESSTLLEPIVRLYRHTGEQRFLDFARYIVDAGGAYNHNLIDEALSDLPAYKMGGSYPKAYEQTSFFEGLLEYYRVTGDDRVRRACLRFFDKIHNQELTIIGNAGADQPYHPQVYGEAWSDTAREQTNTSITRMMETCVGVTWIKYCTRIFQLTGDPRAMDDIEKYIYNGLTGAMKPDGEGFSYVNLLNGNKVNDKGWGWDFGKQHVTCCNLNGPMGLAYIPVAAATQTTAGISLNQFESGRILAKTPGGRMLKLTVASDMPASGSVKIRVEPPAPEQFTVQVRIPAWSERTKLTVNGEAVAATPGTYAQIARVWQPGDVISVELDMRCRVMPAPKGSDRKGDNMVALVRGPLVLARDENVDKDYAKPVQIKAKDGFVELTPEKPTRGARVQFRVPLEDGSTIPVVDYASINNWDGSHVQTWIPYQ